MSPHDQTVQFYNDDTSLTDSEGSFIKEEIGLSCDAHERDERRSSYWRRSP
jgi:hypothetical protein